MARSIAFVFAVLLSQVLAEKTIPDFVENVRDAQGRIVSGWEAYPGQHPHQISLRMVNAFGQASSCGGSVVERNWVITAAHCTAQQVSLLVRAGVTYLNSPQYTSETSEYYNHPNYDSSRPGVVQPNDISLVKVHIPFVYTDLLRPIRVQPAKDANRDYEGNVVVASGFGRTWTDGEAPQTLNWVFLRAISNFRCSLSFGTALIVDSSICAQFYNVTSQSVCQGDSGGPLVYTGHDQVPTLIGVTSFVAGRASGGCHSGHPAGFIRPGPFHGWFEGITGIDFDNLDEWQTTTLPPTTPTTTELPTTTEEITTPEVITTTQAPTTTEEPVTTPEPEPESESGESEEDSEEDPELSELLKRLEVLVKVKVRMNKFKKHHESHIIKERS